MIGLGLLPLVGGGAVLDRLGGVGGASNDNEEFSATADVGGGGGVTRDARMMGRTAGNKLNER